MEARVTKETYEKTVKALSELLESPDPQVRLLAARELLGLWRSEPR
jgi:HEAT repeat protein